MCTRTAIWRSGRVDAVVLDEVLAERGVRRNPGLVNQDTDLGVGYYVGVLAADRTALRDRINPILREAMHDRRLEAIFERWNMWNEDQPRLYAQILASDATELVPSSAVAVPGLWESTRRYFPALVGAAVITIVLSCAAMMLAVVVGVLVASGAGLWHAAAADGADQLGRGDSRHAAPPAAVRALFWAGVGRPAPGLSRGAHWSRSQLRGIRERNLSRGTRGGCRMASWTPRERSDSRTGRRSCWFAVRRLSGWRLRR